MKVLITGAGGQIARALLAGAPPGMSVTALTHRELDITDEGAVDVCVARLSPDVIINGAAYTAVDRAESDVEVAARINTDGPRYLALAAARSGARLVHISTDFVFDGASSTPYRPDSPTNPL
ncbi:MAG TPA: sugar nucleotide-binding protein, partial [Steroidobacteraceae bacterium]|nr:sugar nucleotide-binding protein [Steroidobacteraceae bacterium]